MDGDERASEPSLTVRRHKLFHRIPLIILLALASCGDESAGGTSGETCARSSDCSDPSARCVEGRCEVECIADRDCAEGESCIDGSCRDGALTCRADMECPFGQVCSQGLCEVVEGFCQRNADCPSGMSCDRDTERCVPSGEVCATERDCFAGEQCVNGRCTGGDTGPDVEADVPTDVAPDIPEDVPEDVPPDVPMDVEEDASDDAPADVPADADAAPDMDAAEDPDASEIGEDVMEDADVEDVMEDSDVADEDAADADASTMDPAPIGVYQYERLPIGGLDEVHKVIFHPSGAYALVIENTNVIHVLDWASESTVRYDLDPPGGDNLYFDDAVFDPSGSFALIVGTRRGSGDEGRVYRFDHTTWSVGGSGMPDDGVFTELEGARRPGELFAAIALPHTPGLPWVMSRSVDNTIVRLRELDPADGSSDTILATNSSAGCVDMTFVDNEFDEPGILVSCGINGQDALYYTWIGGIGEWRDLTGNRGNLGSTDAYPGGEYALLIGWSARRVYRAQDGTLNQSVDAPNFSTIEISNVDFAPDGRRALITGGAGRSPLRAAVLEYRHNEYECDAFGCDLTDVSISNFDQPPYNATGNWRLNGASFRPGCDGGLIGGGYSNFQGSTGLVIRFQIENGVACP